jgi:hypothetical protein
MDPGLYALIEPVPFMVLVNPGATPVCQNFYPPAVMKMVDYAFERNKNYFLSYMNINRACFRMLDDSVPIQFKVSNIPTLMGWNASMSIQEILTQLETAYSKPTPMALHNKDLLFRSPMATNDALELLFYRFEHQEIATLAGDPYTQMQIINTVVCILMQAQVLPSKELDTWEQTPNKTYPGLKTFIHEAYTRRLQSLALRMTTGQQGYALGGGTNMFNIWESEDKDMDTADDATTITATQTAAFTTASTLGTTYGGATTIPSKISLAITQLAANQLAIQQQMVAMMLAANALAHHTQLHIPPIQNMGQQPFAGAAHAIFNTGCGGGGCQRGGHGHGCLSSRGGGHGRGAFSHQFLGVVGGIPPFVNGPPVAVVPPTGARVNAPFQSNTTKRCAN